MGKLIISNNSNGLLLLVSYIISNLSLNPLKKMSMPIIQMRRLRLGEGRWFALSQALLGTAGRAPLDSRL